ncbi:MAG: leucine-rich repeat protein [Clostridia bacterium]|nr:leucine-rich repeat protein [Clostridia bacterium]
MKKTAGLFLCLCAAFCLLFAVTVFAATCGDLTYSVLDGEITIDRCDEFAAGELTIPAEIDGYPVTSIGEYAFFDRPEVTGVAIPSSVTRIGAWAFSGCNSLTGIEIPSSVTSIGQYALSACSALMGIEIPSSVTSIGNCAFYYCHALTGIAVDADNPAYGSDAQGVLYDKEFTTLICCPGGKTACSIPSGVTRIGQSAFEECTALTGVEIPPSVTGIGAAAFYHCNSLASVIFAAESQCTGIGAYGFARCGALAGIELPSSVTHIGDAAFWDCGALESVEIPSSVTGIGKRAFYECSALTGVEIPSSVTDIGAEAFGACVRLTGIAVDADDPAYASDAQGVLYDKEMRILICCPGGKAACSIPSSVTRIEDGAFSRCRGLAHVAIPPSVTGIGERAFCDCSWLISIEIPLSVTGIGALAFYNCSNLTEITIRNADCTVYDHADTLPAGATIYGRSDSAAQSYAQEYGRTFVLATCAHPSFGEWTVETPAACTENGHGRHTCLICGDILEGSIPATGHTEVELPALAPTCTENGLTAGVKCSVCDAVLTAQEGIPALGHDYLLTGTCVEATPETPGTGLFTCTRCGGTKYDDLVMRLGNRLSVTLPADNAITAVSAESVTSGDAFDAIADRAAEKPFEMHSVAYTGAETLDCAADFTLDVPTGMSAETVKVYRISGDFITDMHAEVGGDGRLHFAADHLDSYVIAQGELVKYGDTTGDGRITLSDTLRLLRNMADGGVSMDIAAADMSGDENLSVLDALLILHRFLNP